jgi:hypothetical protein
MPANTNDTLARILDDTSPIRRYDIWRWLKITANNFQLPGEINQLGMRAAMASALSNNPRLAELIKQEAEQLIPAKQLEWINEGNRQVVWLNTRFKDHPTYSGSRLKAAIAGLTGKDLLIASIDLLNINIKSKFSFLNELENSWTEHKKGDKQFQWFEDEEQKCLLAGKWINKNIQLDGILSIELSEYPIENYENLLIFFDHAKLDHYQKIVYIEKIRKSWHQQKYRENLIGKGQYNFILSDKAIARLDKLADTYELSRAKILDILLKMESEQNRYLPERIRLLKNES